MTTATATKSRTRPQSAEAILSVFLTDEQILERLELEHYRSCPDTRFYVNKARNARNHLRKLGDWASGGARRGVPLAGWHRITHGQHAAGVYGVEPTRENGRSRSRHNARVLNYLARAGLIEWRPVTTASGKFVCLEYRFLPVEPLRRSSSDGRAAAL